MKKHWITLCIGCFIGSWIPFTIDQILTRHDEFGVINLALGERISLISLSPDGLMRVLFVEIGDFYGERYFEMRLQQKGDSEVKTIFSLTDADPPEVGSDRIVWSLDSSKFILLNRRYEFPASADKSSYQLANGEKLLLLYDVRRNQIYFGYPKQTSDSYSAPGSKWTLNHPKYTLVQKYPLIPKDTLEKFRQDGTL